MIEYLKELLIDLKNMNSHIIHRQQKILSIESAIEILEKLRKEDK